MPRPLRLDIAGYHHVVNRGVAQRKIFITQEDYHYFLEQLCHICSRNGAKLHSYCLMSNHYHLLIETELDNLSKIMRLLNAQYASYFNRKNKRVGHLWQGRCKSWYVTDESYLYTLIRYIESNPIKAKMVNELGEYAYSSYNAFIKKDKVISCLSHSIMFVHYKTKEERKAFFTFSYDPAELEQIAKSSRLVVAPLKKKALSLSVLNKMIARWKTKKERNEKVKEASSLGYTQSQIAKELSLSQGAVSNILKS